MMPGVSQEYRQAKGTGKAKSIAAGLIVLAFFCLLFFQLVLLREWTQDRPGSFVTSLCQTALFWVSALMLLVAGKEWSARGWKLRLRDDGIKLTPIDHRVLWEAIERWSFEPSSQGSDKVTVTLNYRRRAKERQWEIVLESRQADALCAELKGRGQRVGAAPTRTQPSTWGRFLVRWLSPLCLVQAVLCLAVFLASPLSTQASEHGKHSSSLGQKARHHLRELFPDAGAMNRILLGTGLAFAISGGLLRWARPPSERKEVKGTRLVDAN